MTAAVQRKARGEQSKAAKRATLELFQAKKPKQEEMDFPINDQTVSVLFIAIGRQEYDKLLTECPASTKQRAEGASYDQDKFAPKLLSRVVADPAISEVDWRNIWNDPNWNRNELGDLFYKAVDVCSKPLNPDPTDGD